jgi:transcriptional regulator with XRE-family HTH domain
MVTMTTRRTTPDVGAPDGLQQTLGDRLSKSLKYAGMSHQDMAEYLEVHRNSVGAWCTDRNRIMPAILRLWAQRVGLPLEWLREGTWPERQAEPVKKVAAKAPVKKVTRTAGKPAASQGRRR